MLTWGVPWHRGRNTKVMQWCNEICCRKLRYSVHVVTDTNLNKIRIDKHNFLLTFESHQIDTTLHSFSLLYFLFSSSWNKHRRCILGKTSSENRLLVTEGYCTVVRGSVFGEAVQTLQDYNRALQNRVMQSNYRTICRRKQLKIRALQSMYDVILQGASSMTQAWHLNSGVEILQTLHQDCYKGQNWLIIWACLTLTCTQ
jgi:hypothetical protein